MRCSHPKIKALLCLRRPAPAAPDGAAATRVCGALVECRAIMIVPARLIRPAGEPHR